MVKGGVKDANQCGGAHVLVVHVVNVDIRPVARYLSGDGMRRKDWAEEE